MRAAFVALLAISAVAHAADDVPDVFRRRAGVEPNKVYASAAPSEVVDPFTGVLNLKQTDLALKGRAGLDLEIARHYSSRIWGRANPTLTSGGLIAAKEHGPLGWGWTMHLGRLRNPRGIGSPGTCTPDNPTFEAPDGASTPFYADGAGGFVSTTRWKLLPDCGGERACVITDQGLVYELAWSDGYCYDGSCDASSSAILPVSAIRDVHGNTITVNYVPGSAGAMSSVVDSYGRVVTFTYDVGTRRIVEMKANDATYTFEYATYATPYGNQAFLTAVVPPVGPRWRYEYNVGGGPANNQWALSRMTYPSGATIDYGYEAVSFWTGYDSVPFSPVTSRIVGGRDVPAAEWRYTYYSSEQQATTIVTRPDGLYDSYLFHAMPSPQTPVAGQQPRDVRAATAASASTAIATAAHSSQTRAAAPGTSLLSQATRSGASTPSRATQSIARAPTLAVSAQRVDTAASEESCGAIPPDGQPHSEIDPTMFGELCCIWNTGFGRWFDCPRSGYCGDRTCQNGPLWGNDPDPQFEDCDTCAQDCCPCQYAIDQFCPITQYECGGAYIEQCRNTIADICGKCPEDPGIQCNQAFHVCESIICPLKTKEQLCTEWRDRRGTGPCDAAPDGCGGTVDCTQMLDCPYRIPAGLDHDLWRVGRPTMIVHASGAQVETFTWERGPTISTDHLIAPFYGEPGMCDGLLWDPQIRIGHLAAHQVYGDGATYTTRYTAFDDFDQPTQIQERGQVGRIRTLTYATFPELHVLHGRVASESTCIGGECVESTSSYDAFADLVTQTRGGVTMRYEHDRVGELVRITDAAGAALVLDGYEGGVPTTLTLGPLTTVRREVSWEGWITAQTDARGHATRYRYDAVGRLLETRPMNTNATGVTYADDGSWMRTARGPFGKTVHLDGLGRPMGTEDNEGVRTTVGYDALGRRVYQSYPHHDLADDIGDTFTYDGLGRVTQVAHADGTSAQTRYSAGWVYRTDERGLSSQQGFESFGSPDERRLRQSIDALWSTTNYYYDARGSVVAIDAPDEMADRSFTYDDHGYLVSETNPESGTVVYERDAVGQETSRTDALGTIAFGYDERHRLVLVDRAGAAHDVTYTYDEGDHVVSSESASGGRYEYSYDENDRLTQQRWTFAGRTYVTGYAYDGQDCLTRLTYPTGTALQLTCDSDGRLTSVGRYLAAVVYHPSGQPAELLLGNGRRVVTEFDLRARPVTQDTVGLVRQAYEYDAVGNLVSYESSLAGPPRTMAYDELSRLISADGPWGSTGYAYDALGNRLQKITGDDVTTYTYSPEGRLVSTDGASARSFTWDDAGNLTSDGVHAFVWDDAGKLVESSDGARYAYNPLGQRVRRQDAHGTVLYHYDAGGHLIAETTEDGHKLVDYYYAAGRLIAGNGRF